MKLDPIRYHPTLVWLKTNEACEPHCNPRSGINGTPPSRHPMKYAWGVISGIASDHLCTVAYGDFPLISGQIYNVSILKVKFSQDWN